MKSIFRNSTFFVLSLLVLTSCQTSVTLHNVAFDSNGGSPVEPQTVKNGEKVEKPADPTRDGYTFKKWTYNEREWSFKYYVVTEDMTLLANWDANTYTLVLNNDNTNMGSVSGAGLYNYDSEVTISAVPTAGYYFLGWYDPNNRLVSNQTTYTFNMGFDLTLTAKWNEKYYSVVLNPNGGTVSQTTVNVRYNDYYSLPTPTRAGYYFDGWFDDSILVSDGGIWNYTSNKTFIAHWTTIDYPISYTLNGGINDASNPSSYTVEDDVTFAAPSKTGYTFLGWFKGDNAVLGIPKGSTGKVRVEARWSAALNRLLVTSEDTSKGTVAIVSGSGYSDESITVVATPVGDCVFMGWYDESSRVSNQTTYTFTMPTKDYSLLAHFLTKEEEEEARKHGTIPLLSDDERTISYGLYPQKNVNDSSLVSALNALTKSEPNGWYLYDGDYYAKVKATPFTSYCFFDSGEKIVDGTKYWFKCEPIVWNVLRNNSGDYFVVSKFLLDTHIFSSGSVNVNGQLIHGNDYKNSGIRSWLNVDFYNSAFSLGNKQIQTMVVDNSASTTDSPDNTSICENTEDKIFLLSYQDYINNSYGFETYRGSSIYRYCKTTDWARARGASFHESIGAKQFNGIYWTRSPYYPFYSDAFCVLQDGRLNFRDVDEKGLSVRPSLSIKIL